jgi:hypothetical protein
MTGKMALVLAAVAGMVLLSPMAYAQTATELEGTWFHVGRVEGGVGLLMSITFRAARCSITVNRATSFSYDLIEFAPEAHRFKLRIGAKVIAYVYQISPHYLILYTDNTPEFPANQERARVITLLGKSN